MKNQQAHGNVKIPEKNIRDFFLKGRMLETDSTSSVPGQLAWVSFFLTLRPVKVERMDVLCTDVP